MSDDLTETAKENLKGGQQESKKPWEPPERSDHQPSKGEPPVRKRRAEDNETA